MLWRSALSGTFHGPLCNCFRGAFPVIDAKTLEADVLDNLLPRYTHDSVAFLVDLLKTRQANPEGSFVDWLRSLRKAEITEGAYGRLTEIFGTCSRQSAVSDQDLRAPKEDPSFPSPSVYPPVRSARPVPPRWGRCYHTPATKFASIRCRARSGWRMLDSSSSPSANFTLAKILHLLTSA